MSCKLLRKTMNCALFEKEASKMFKISKRYTICLLLFFIYFFGLDPGCLHSQVKCFKDLWIIVDCSGSMYSRSPAFRERNQIQFRGIERNLLEVSATLIDETINRLEGSETRIRIFTFYSTVKEFDKSDWRSFYDSLDTNRDGRIFSDDRPGGFDGENYTNLGGVALKLRAELEKLSSKKPSPVAILLFTDGNSDYRPNGFNGSTEVYFRDIMNSNRHRLGELMQQKNVMLRVAGLIPDLSDARDFVELYLEPVVGDRVQFIQPAEDLARVIEKQLDAALQDLARLTIDTKKIQIKNGKVVSIAAELTNDSCADLNLQELSLKLTDEHGHIHSKNPESVEPRLPITFGKSDRSSKDIQFIFDLSDLKEGLYISQVFSKDNEGRVNGRSGRAPFSLFEERIEWIIEGEQNGLDFSGKIRLNAQLTNEASIQSAFLNLKGADGRIVAVPLNEAAGIKLPAFNEGMATEKEFAFDIRIPIELRKKENREIGIGLKVNSSSSAPIQKKGLRIVHRPEVAAGGQSDHLIYRQPELLQAHAKKMVVDDEEQWVIPLQPKRFEEFLEWPIPLDGSELQLENFKSKLPVINASPSHQTRDPASTQAILRRSDIVRSVLEMNRTGNLGLKIRLRSSSVDISGESVVDFIMPLPLRLKFPFFEPKKDLSEMTYGWQSYVFPNNAREELSRREWMVLLPSGDDLIAVANENKAVNLSGLAGKLGGSETRDRIANLVWLHEIRFITPSRSEELRIVKGQWLNENKVPVSFRWRLKKIGDTAETVLEREQELQAGESQVLDFGLPDVSGAPNLYSLEILQSKTTDGGVPCDVVWGSNHVLGDRGLYVVSERQVDTWVLILIVFIGVSLFSSIALFFLRRK